MPSHTSAKRIYFDGMDDNELNGVRVELAPAKTCHRRTEDVIDLDERRRIAGTIWFTGKVCCIACGAQGIAVLPMPAWALAPAPVECIACGGSCLAVGSSDIDPEKWSPP